MPFLTMLRAAGWMAALGTCFLLMGLSAVARGAEPPPSPEPALPDTDDKQKPNVSTQALPFWGDACHPHYWIVSSRTARQGKADPCGGCLEYFERTPDGCLRRTDLASMTSQLIPGVPVCIYTHGMFVTWESTLSESHATYKWIRRACPNRPLHVIFFSWPSDRQTTLLAGFEITCKGRQAEYNAFHLAALLSRIPDCHPVTLIGHSHGARMVIAALHLAGGGALQGVRFCGCVGSKRIRAILAAAAFDHHWLNDGGRYDRALCRAEGVLNLRNQRDIALKFYPLLRPFAHRALGASGVTWRDRRRQSCSCKIHNLNVTNLIGYGHFWPNFFTVPALARTIAPWIYYPSSTRISLPTTVTPTHNQKPAPSPADKPLPILPAPSHDVKPQTQTVP